MAGIYIAVLAVIVVSGLVLWFARACSKGTLQRNLFLGYRTRLTLTNRDAWIAVHKALAPFVFIAGIGAVLGAIVAAFLAAVRIENVPPIILGASVGWIVVWVILGTIPAHLRASAFKRTLKSVD